MIEAIIMVALQVGLSVLGAYKLYEVLAFAGNGHIGISGWITLYLTAWLIAIAWAVAVYVVRGAFLKKKEDFYAPVMYVAFIPLLPAFIVAMPVITIISVIAGLIGEIRYVLPRAKKKDRLKEAISTGERDEIVNILGKFGVADAEMIVDRAYQCGYNPEWHERKRWDERKKQEW